MINSGGIVTLHASFDLRHTAVSSLFYNVSSVTQIQKKISQIGKRVFSYLARNQKAIAISLGSYVCIQAGVTAAELWDKIAIEDLENCQSMFCDQWNNSTENENNDFSFLEFRCNADHPNYHPFTFLENCIKDLCEYTRTLGQSLEGCVYPAIKNDELPQGEDSLLEPKLWKALCPTIHMRHFTPQKKLKAINSCIQNLCNYYHVFSLNVPKMVSQFCETANLDKLNHLVERMNKLMHKIENKLEENEFWDRTNSISSAVGGVLGVISSIIALGVTIVAYKAQIRNANIRPIVVNLRNMIPALSETTTSLRIENIHNTPVQTEGANTLETLLSEVQGLTLELSEILDHTVSYREEAETVLDSSIVGEELGSNAMVGLGTGAIGGLGSLAISGVGTKVIEGVGMGERGAINSRIEVIKKEGLEALWKLGVSVIDPSKTEITMDEEEIISNKKFYKSIVVPGQALHLPKGLKWDGIIQDYVNDFILGPFTDPELTEVQANRLNGTFEDWDRAFCTYNYPNILFCRYPTENNTSPGTLLPTHYTNTIVRHNLPGLCYILLSELWCNWAKVFDLFSKPESNHITSTNSDCSWDLFSLHVDNKDFLQVSATGHCYNQSAIFKV